EFHLPVTYVGGHGYLFDRLTPQPGHRQDHPPQILQIGSAHARHSARSCESAASGIRSAWMNSDDFEVASNGYGVQNERRLPGSASDAARNDQTSSQAAVFARQIGRAHV